MLYDSTSSEETSSENEDDLELLLLDTMLTTKRLLRSETYLFNPDFIKNCEGVFNCWIMYALHEV